MNALKEALKQKKMKALDIHIKVMPHDEDAENTEGQASLGESDDGTLALDDTSKVTMPKPINEDGGDAIGKAMEDAPGNGSLRSKAKKAFGKKK